jgi:hypothetical protein
VWLDELSDDAIAALTAAGWTRDRAVDVMTWDEEIRSSGFVVSEFAYAWWRSLGGLTIPPAGLLIDPTAPRGYGRWPAVWADKFGQSFCPVGVRRDHDGVWVGAEGVVLTELGGSHFRKVADGSAAALEILLFGRPPWWRRR